MTEKYIAEPLGIIDPDNSTIEENFLFALQYDMFSDKNVRLFKKKSYLVIHTIYWSKKKFDGQPRKSFL